ncbi:NADH dehydrogenase (quinone), partial [mine drainage metagenome]
AADQTFALVSDLTRTASILVEAPTPAWLDGANPRTGPRPPPGGIGPGPPGQLRFPYGPVTFGLFEAGRIDLETPGEKVAAAFPRTGYKHRAIEASVVGRTPREALPWIERRVGPNSVAHAATFLAAAEAAEGTSVPERELWLRAVGTELQRLQAHLGHIGRSLDAAGQPVGTAQFAALAEELRRSMGRWGGHRWLFGLLDPGYPYRRLERPDLQRLAGEVAGLRRRFDQIWDLARGTRIYVDRLQSTAVVDRKTALAFGAVGPVARGSGIAWDDRSADPTPPYDLVKVEPPVEVEGDALARILVRVAEIRRSAELIEEMADRWPGDLGRVEYRAPGWPPGRGCARSETPGRRPRLR